VSPENRITRDSRYLEFERKTTRTLRALVAWSLLIGVVSLYLLTQNGQRQEDIGRQQDAIQQQRAESIWTTCNDQNRRHDDAIRELNELLERVPVGPERERARLRTEATERLIDVLVPRQNCDQLVRERVR
jgi:hypothetical protein